MLLCLLLFLAATATAQKAQSNAKDPQQNPQVLIATPIGSAQNQNGGGSIPIPQELRQFYAQQQFAPEVYGLTYAQPQYQNGAGIPRLQPQIVLYGPGGQGQPILINPGNPPGNFLIPQGPGPNVVVRNNPPPGFPVAGYPKPAHIPPIEKDAEEVPTNPSKIPPLQSDAKPTPQPKRKPEKLETFNEPNQPDQNPKPQEGQFPQPNNINLRPGQRFFILNGDSMYNNYPFEAAQPNFKYTNVDLYSRPAPTGFAQEPPQYLQDDRYQQQTIPLPDLVLRNNQQPNTHQQYVNNHQNQKNSEDRTAQQYFNPNSLYGQNQEYQPYFVDQQGQLLSNQPGQYQNQFLSQQGQFQNQHGQLFQSQQGQILSQQVQEPVAQQPNPKASIIPPHLIGQFRYTPNSVPDFYQFKDDLENDAIVVDASYDSPNSLNGRGGNFRADEESSTTFAPQPAEKEPESSMAQAAPQGTAIAGPGGVAGSAPRGTALVGKGGLAVSSPQATAVAGTKDEEKRNNKKPSRRNI